MIKFEQGKTYYLKKENQYELFFECTRYDGVNACFMLTKINANVEQNKCPIFFSILGDYFNHFYGKMIKLYVTSSIEQGPIRQVAFSNYENYLWIDSLNVCEILKSV